MSHRISQKAAHDFWLTVEYLRSDLATWETVRNGNPDKKCIRQFRTLFARQVARLESMAECGIVTPTSRKLIERARNCLAGM